MMQKQKELVLRPPHVLSGKKFDKHAHTNIYVIPEKK
jgi:hypothetical protein